MANAFEYISNLGKSVSYSAFDAIKETNPAIADFADQNAELGKILYESVKDFKTTKKKAKDYVINSSVGEFAKEYKKSFFEDIKSGKFYNREREDELNARAAGSLGTDWGDDPYDALENELGGTVSNSPSMSTDDDISDTDKTSLVMDRTGDKVTQGIAMATGRAAEYQVEALNEGMTKQQKHLDLLSGRLNTGIASLNSSISQLIEFNDKATKVHYENSKNFYSTMTTLTQDNNKLLKELVELEKSRSGATESANVKKDESFRFSDITSGGMPDLKAYGKAIAHNVSAQSGGMLDMIKLGGDGNALLSFASSPLKFIPDMIVKSVVPKIVKDASTSFNETLSGAFASAMLKANQMSNNADSDLLSKIGEILKVNIGVKSTIDTGKYNRGAIPWDGESKMALTRVIPDYLAKILAATTGTREKLYDYKTGKYRDMAAVKEEVNKMSRTYSDRAASDLISAIKDELKYINFAGNKDEHDALIAEIHNMFEKNYSEGKVLNFMGKSAKKLDSSIVNDLGLSYDSAKIIIPILQSLAEDKNKRSMFMDYNRRVLENRDAQNRDMKYRQESSSSIESALFNNLGLGEYINTIDKNINGKIQKLQINDYRDLKGSRKNKNPMLMNNIYMVKDQYNHNIFWYLQRYTKEFEKMRTEGVTIRGGIPNTDNNIASSSIGGGYTNVNGVVVPSHIKSTSNNSYNKSLDSYSIPNDNPRINFELDSKRAERDSFDRNENNRAERINSNYKKGKSHSAYMAFNYNKAYYDTESDEDMLKEYRNYLRTKGEYQSMKQTQKDAKERKEKQDKSVFGQLVKADSLSDRTIQIINGVDQLAHKPAEFLAAVIGKADRRLFEMVYGDEDDDKLSAKSLMGTLIARLTSTFNNFSDFLKDDIVNPLKETLFGEDGLDLKGKLKEIATSDETKDFLQRMFGNKINGIKKSFKDVYGDIAGIVKTPEDKVEALNYARSTVDYMRSQNKINELKDAGFRTAPGMEFATDENGKLIKDERGQYVQVADPRLFVNRMNNYSKVQQQRFENKGQEKINKLLSDRQETAKAELLKGTFKDNEEIKEISLHYKKELDELKSKISEQKKHIKKLKRELKGLNRNYNEKAKGRSHEQQKLRIEEKTKQINDAEEALKLIEKQYRDLSKKKMDALISTGDKILYANEIRKDFEKDIKDINKNIEKTQNIISTTEEEITDLKNQQSQYDEDSDEYNQLQETITEKKNKISEANDKVKGYKDNLKDIDSQINERVGNGFDPHKYVVNDIREKLNNVNKAINAKDENGNTAYANWQMDTINAKINKAAAIGQMHSANSETTLSGSDVEKIQNEINVIDRLISSEKTNLSKLNKVDTSKMSNEEKKQHQDLINKVKDNIKKLKNQRKEKAESIKVDTNKLSQYRNTISDNNKIIGIQNPNKKYAKDYFDIATKAVEFGLSPSEISNLGLGTFMNTQYNKMAKAKYDDVMSKVQNKYQSKTDKVNEALQDFTYTHNKEELAKHHKIMNELGGKEDLSDEEISRFTEASDAAKKIKVSQNKVLNKVKKDRDNIANSISAEKNNSSGLLSNNIFSAMINRNNIPLYQTKEDDIDMHARGGQVTKTGIAAVSEGELIIPPEYNPFYNGDSSLSKRMNKEIEAKKNFTNFLESLKSFKVSDKIGQYAEGTGPEGVVINNGVAGNQNNSRERSSHTSANMTHSSDEEAAPPHKKNRRKTDYKRFTQKQVLDMSELLNNGTSAEDIAIKYDCSVDDVYTAIKDTMGSKIGRSLLGLAHTGDDLLGITDRLNAEIESTPEDKSKLFNAMIDDIKGDASKYIPSALGSALIGGGVSLLTGAVGGPLLGAAIGAATDLTVSSDKVKDWLFGEIDENGDRKGNILPKHITKIITKYVPDMAKYGVVGGITTLLPGGLGPIQGLILGSAIGFAKNNNKVKEFLFGNEEDENSGLISKKTREFLEKSIPEGILGALGGAIFSPTPFGLMGNILIGSAVGFATQTDTFKDALFGKYNEETKQREGGIIGAIRHGFVDPVVEIGGTIKDKGLKWIKNDIVDPVTSALKPIATQGGLILRKVLGLVGGIGKKTFKEKLGSSASIFADKVSHKLATVGKAGVNIGSHLLGPVGNIISAPYRTIGSIGDHFRNNQIRNGNARYMTAVERNTYRDEMKNNVNYDKYNSDEYGTNEKGENVLLHRKGEIKRDQYGNPIELSKKRYKFFANTLGRRRLDKRHGLGHIGDVIHPLSNPDKYEKTDRLLADMNIDDLDAVRNSLATLKDKNKINEELGKATSDVNELFTNTYANTIGDKAKFKILKTLKKSDNKFNDVKKIISGLDLADGEKGHILNAFNAKFSNYEALQGLADGKQFAKDFYFKKFRKAGFSDLSDKTLDKYLYYIDQERNVKGKMDTIENLNDAQKERHKEIVDLFEELIDTVRGFESDEAKQDALNRRNARHKRSFLDKIGVGNKVLSQAKNVDLKHDDDGSLYYSTQVPKLDEDGKVVKDKDGNVVMEEVRTDIQGRRLDNGQDLMESKFGWRSHIKSGIRKTKQLIGRNFWNKQDNGIISKGISKGYHGALGAVDNVITAHKAKKKYKNMSQEEIDKYYEDNGISSDEMYENMSADEKSKKMKERAINDMKHEDGVKTKFVSDFLGHPIQWIKDKQHGWIEKANSENKQTKAAALTFVSNAAGKVTGKIGDIVTDFKDAFNHVFHIDEEKDGWGKKILKVGTGIFGALTVAGFMPILEAYWTNKVAPSLQSFWDEKVYPIIQPVVEPIKPTIAKAAIGIDTAIRSIPNAIENLGRNIINFITNDLPVIWTNKIIPFYSNGIDWVVSKLSWISEGATKILLKALPQVLKGVVKGAVSFLTTDIGQMFGASTNVPVTYADAFGYQDAVNIDNLANDSNSSGGFAEKLYSNVFGESAQQTLGLDNTTKSSPSETVSKLTKYYSSNEDASGYPYDDLYGMSSSDKINTSGDYSASTNNSSSTNSSSVIDTPVNTYSQSRVITSNKSTSSNTNTRVENHINNVAKNTNNTINNSTSTANTAPNNQINNTAVYNSGNGKIRNVINTAIYKGKSNINRQLYNNNGAFNGSTKGNSEVSDKNPGLQKSDNGINYFNSNYVLENGMTLSNARITPAGLVYDDNTGMLIPNIFYDPATQLYTNKPTEAAEELFSKSESGRSASSLSEFHDIVLKENYNKYPTMYSNALMMTQQDDDGNQKTVQRSDNMGSLFSHDTVGGRFGAAIGKSFISGGKIGRAASVISKAGYAVAKKSPLLLKPITSIPGYTTWAAGKVMGFSGTAGRFTKDKVGDKVGGYALKKAATKFTGKKAAIEAAELAAKKSAEKAAEKGAEETIKSVVVGKSLKDRIIKLIGGAFEDLASNEKIAGYFTKAAEAAGRDGSKATFKIAMKEVGEKLVEKILKKVSSKVIQGLVKLGAKAAAGVLSVGIFTVIDVTYNFYSGWRYAAATFNLTDNEFDALDEKSDHNVTLPLRFISAITKTVLEVFTAGILDESFVLGLVSDALMGFLGVNEKDLNEAVNKSLKEVYNYNKKHGTNYSLDEYVKKDTLWGRFKSFLGLYKKDKSVIKTENNEEESKKYQEKRQSFVDKYYNKDTKSANEIHMQEIHNDETQINKYVSDHASEYKSSKSSKSKSAKGSGIDTSYINRYISSAKGSGVNKVLDIDVARKEREANNKYYGVDKEVPSNSTKTINTIYNISGKGNNLSNNDRTTIRVKGLDSNKQNKSSINISAHPYYQMAPEENVVHRTIIKGKRPSVNNINNEPNIILPAAKGSGLPSFYSAGGSNDEAIYSVVDSDNNVVATGLTMDEATALNQKTNKTSKYTPITDLTGKNDSTQVIDYTRSTNITNEFIYTQMMLESSANYGAISWTSTTNGTAAVGILQWKDKEGSKVLYNILMSDKDSAKQILGEALFNDIRKKKVLKDKNTDNKDKNNIMKLLVSEQGQDVQIEMAKKEAISCINKVNKYFSNPKIILFWGSIYSRNTYIANDILGAASKELGKKTSLTSFYYFLINNYDVPKNDLSRYKKAFQLAISSPCTKVKPDKFDKDALTSVISTDVKKYDDESTNWMEGLFNAIRTMGQAYYGIADKGGISASNIDMSKYNDINEANPDDYIDPLVQAQMEKAVKVINSESHVLKTRLKKVREIIDIDARTAIATIDQKCPKFIDLVSNSKYFKDYSKKSDDDKTKLYKNAKLDVKIEEEFAKKLNDNKTINKLYGNIPDDERTKIYFKFIVYFRMVGTKKAIDKLNTDISYYPGVFKVSFFADLLSKNDVFVSGLKGCKSRKDAIDYLTKYQSSFSKDLANGKFMSDMQITINDLRTAYKELGSDTTTDYGKEKSWNIAESILSSFDDATRDGMIGLYSTKYNVPDFNYMLSGAKKSDNYNQIKDIFYANDKSITNSKYLTFKQWSNGNNGSTDYARYQSYLANTGISTVTTSETIQDKIAKLTGKDRKYAISNPLNPYSIKMKLNSDSLSALDNLKSVDPHTMVKFKDMAKAYFQYRVKGENITDEMLNNYYQASSMMDPGYLQLLDTDSGFAQVQNNFKQYYNLWKKDPKNVGGPFIMDNATNTNELLHAKTRLDVYKEYNKSNPKKPIDDKTIEKAQKMYDEQANLYEELASYNDSTDSTIPENVRKSKADKLLDKYLSSKDAEDYFKQHKGLFNTDKPVGSKGYDDKSDGYSDEEQQWIAKNEEYSNESDIAATTIGTQNLINNNNTVIPELPKKLSLIADRNSILKSVKSGDIPDFGTMNALISGVASISDYKKYKKWCENNNINVNRSIRIPSDIDAEPDDPETRTYKFTLGKHDKYVEQQQNDFIKKNYGVYVKNFDYFGSSSAKGSGFISQLDYGNVTFADGESIAQAGCGPAVAAMAIDNMQAGKGSGTMAATTAIANKYKNANGTQADYFQDVFSKAGAHTNYITGSNTSGKIKSSLASGEQVVLMGRDSANKSKANSPFGPNNHYVLATGVGNGKVMVSDPEQHAPRMYSDKILNKTKLGVAVAKGSGITNISNIDRISAKGSKSMKHANLASWSVPSVSALKKAIISYHHGNCAIAKHAQDYIDAGKKSGLDPRFLLAINAAEVGWNLDQNKCARANNPYDIAAYDSNPFNSKSTGKYAKKTMRDGIIYGACWIKNNYYNKGQTTVYLMRHWAKNPQHQYCTGNEWENTIASIMKAMPKNTKLSYDTKSLNSDKVSYNGSSSNGNSSESSKSKSTPSGTWLEQLTNAVTNMGNGYFGNKVEDSSSESSGGNVTSNKDWVSIVKAVKKAMAQQHPDQTYHSDNSHSVKLTINNKTKSVRPDCTGLIMACIDFAFNTHISTNSSDLCSNKSTKNKLKSLGFVKKKWKRSELVEGDIQVRNGHGCIVAETPGKTVYNWGKTKYLRMAGSNNDSSSYTYVYHLQNSKKISGKGSGIITRTNIINKVAGKGTELFKNKVSKATSKNNVYKTIKEAKQFAPGNYGNRKPIDIVNNNKSIMNAVSDSKAYKSIDKAVTMAQSGDGNIDETQYAPRIDDAGSGSGIKKSSKYNISSKPTRKNYITVDNVIKSAASGVQRIGMKTSDKDGDIKVLLYAILSLLTTTTNNSNELMDISNLLKKILKKIGGTTSIKSKKKKPSGKGSYSEKTENSAKQINKDSEEAVNIVNMNNSDSDKGTDDSADQELQALINKLQMICS